jgi:hypothetical protein
MRVGSSGKVDTGRAAAATEDLLTMELQDERRSSGEVDTERAAAATEDLLTTELQDK